MRKITLSATERIVMQVIWEEPGIKSKELDKRLKEKGFDFGKNLYGYLNRCIRKGYLKRVEPDYQCVPLVGEESNTRNVELQNLLRTLFHNSPAALMETLVNDRPLTKKEAEEIRALIGSFDEEQQK